MHEKEKKELTNPKKINNEFEEIFREMLVIENSKNLGSKFKYCLAKIQITDPAEIPDIKTSEDAKRILKKFFNLLHKNLRKKDIYLLSDVGIFLILLPDISIDNACAALKRIVLLSSKEFQDRLQISWNIITGTDKEEEIEPYTKNARLLSESGARDKAADPEEILLKNHASNIIFKYFLAALFVFSAIFIAAEILLFYATGKFSIIPGYNMLENFLRNMLPGFFKYFSGPFLNSSAFFLFTAIFLLSCLIFGLGMFTGFAINLKARISGSFLQSSLAEKKKQTRTQENNIPF